MFLEILKNSLIILGHFKIEILEHLESILNISFSLTVPLLGNNILCNECFLTVL